MKFSELWLREWVNPPITSAELINQLTTIGFQVEESEPVSKNFFHGIVIGEIIDCKTHPNLHESWVVKINNGNKKRINVVCNDLNCQKNLRIVIANVGAVLPNGTTVNPIIIQGEKSEGILCTFSMLKLNNYKKKNIIILPPDAPIGCNFYNYLGFNDNVININIPYNRGDCLNIIGLAREIAAINFLKLKKIKINTIKSSITDNIPIIIQDNKQCPKFLGRIIKNIDASVITPINIQEKLHRCGLHSVNVVIDIINYVLLELGHPIHAFDYDQINPNVIYVRSSKIGETLQLPNDQMNLKLFKNTLIIADYHKPLSIAGIIIGNQSSVSTKTRNIFLQSAVFDSFNISKQSRLYHLNTFSSIHYERGIDFTLSEVALDYVTSLLIKVCNGSPGPITSIITDHNLPKPNTIILNKFKLDTVLGFHIKKTEVTRILKHLGFQVKVQNNFWNVLVPTWRFDITVEENLISEIIRIYGYNNIPQIAIKACLTKSSYQTNTISLSKTKTILVNRGYQEIITYSFVNANTQKLLYPQHNPLTLKNPISSDMSVMRCSLWPGLLKTVIYNQNRQQKHIRLFESGICFLPHITNKHQISEQLMISGVRSGLKCNEYWNSKISIVDFYDIKGDVETILDIFNKSNNKIIFKNCRHSALHPGKSAAIYLNDILIGYIGMIHPAIHTQLDLKLNTFVFELSWDVISTFKIPMRIINISKFPKIYRDISLIVPNHVSSANIIDSCKLLNIPQLISVKLIDIYTGDNIPKGYKSFTIKLTLQSQKQTLKEKEILKIINICTMTLETKYQATLR